MPYDVSDCFDSPVNTSSWLLTSGESLFLSSNAMLTTRLVWITFFQFCITHCCEFVRCHFNHNILLWTSVCPSHYLYVILPEDEREEENPKGFWPPNHRWFIRFPPNSFQERICLVHSLKKSALIWWEGCLTSHKSHAFVLSVSKAREIVIYLANMGLALLLFKTMQWRTLRKWSFPF